jgi:hypothetical protein
MNAALVCLLALAPAAKGERPLEIVNPKATYGHLGAPRPRTGILPGDVAHFRFDVKGMTLDAKGRASYSLLVEVLSEDGKELFKLGPHNSIAQNYLGGDLMTCTAQMEVPPETPSGEITMRVVVKDRADGRQTTFQTKGKVLPADFGIIRVGTFADAVGRTPVAPVGVIGGSLYVNFAPVGFDRDKATGQPDLDVSLKVLDADGKQTMPAPLTGRANADIPTAAKFVPMQFGLTLNRAGIFTVVLSATDRLTGKTAEVRFPIRVIAPE